MRKPVGVKWVCLGRTGEGQGRGGVGWGRGGRTNFKVVVLSLPKLRSTVVLELIGEAASGKPVLRYI